MPTRAAAVRSTVEQALHGRRLLSHPFYRRWEQGLLEPPELAEYAEQYRHVESALPAVLETVASTLPPGRARQLVEANLADERGDGDGGGEAHTAMFERFASAISARPAAPASRATRQLVRTQEIAASSDAVAGMAALAAYEIQAAEVASSKSEGLRRHYGLGPDATEFWDVHAELEDLHGAWSLEALARTGARPDDVKRAARAAADAWWAMLDEREARSQLVGMASSTRGST